jgi:hypothetical protein
MCNAPTTLTRLSMELASVGTVARSIGVFMVHCDYYRDSIMAPRSHEDAGRAMGIYDPAVENFAKSGALFYDCCHGSRIVSPAMPSAWVGCRSSKYSFDGSNISKSTIVTEIYLLQIFSRQWSDQHDRQTHWLHGRAFCRGVYHTDKSPCT